MTFGPHQYICHLCACARHCVCNSTECPAQVESCDGRVATTEERTEVADLAKQSPGRATGIKTSQLDLYFLFMSPAVLSHNLYVDWLSLALQFVLNPVKYHFLFAPLPICSINVEPKIQKVRSCCRDTNGCSARDCKRVIANLGSRTPKALPTSPKDCVPSCTTNLDEVPLFWLWSIRPPCNGKPESSQALSTVEMPSLFISMLRTGTHS